VLPRHGAWVIEATFVCYMTGDIIYPGINTRPIRRHRSIGPSATVSLKYSFWC